MKITTLQMFVLETLDSLHRKYPQNDYGFNPWSRRAASICRRKLEPAGLVAINRIAPTHFRYSLTDAGRAAIERTKEASL